MEFEWDEAKRERNLAKHGVDFASFSSFDWDEAACLDRAHSKAAVRCRLNRARCIHAID